MTREERTTAMDKAIEAAARALSPHLRFYGDGHGHAVTIAGKTIKAFLAAIEAAGVRLVPVEATKQMLLAAHMVERDDIELTEDEHRAMYAAFVAASPYAPPEG